MNLLQLAEITSYHGLVEDVNIQCEDKEMCTLLTKLVQGLKGEEQSLRTLTSQSCSLHVTNHL